MYIINFTSCKVDLLCCDSTGAIKLLIHRLSKTTFLNQGSSKRQPNTKIDCPLEKFTPDVIFNFAILGVVKGFFTCQWMSKVR